MKTTYKMLAVALLLAIITFILSRVIWPDPVGMAGPSAALIPHFIFISALESVAFGVGVAFAIFGWLKFRERITADKLSLATFIAIIWTLVSWWPHDNMHRVNPMGDFSGLIKIEYTFHFTLIIAASIIAFYFWRQFSRTPVL